MKVTAKKRGRASMPVPPKRVLEKLLRNCASVQEMADTHGVAKPTMEKWLAAKQLPKPSQIRKRK